MPPKPTMFAGSAFDAGAYRKTTIYNRTVLQCLIQNFDVLFTITHISPSIRINLDTARRILVTRAFHWAGTPDGMYYWGAVSHLNQYAYDGNIFEILHKLWYIEFVGIQYSARTYDHPYSHIKLAYAVSAKFRATGWR